MTAVEVRRVTSRRETDQLSTGTRLVWMVAGAAVLGATVVLAVQDNVRRRRNDLFSPSPMRRMAALTYLRQHPETSDVVLLRDYVEWEERPALQRRARLILAGLEEALIAMERAEEGGETEQNGKADAPRESGETAETDEPGAD